MQLGYRKYLSLAPLIPGLLLWSCGRPGDSLGSEPVELKVEFEILSAPQSPAESVLVDSVRWQPLSFRHLIESDELEIDGSYKIWFRSVSDRSLSLRYDLRFFDRDGFFVDLFHPFGLPLRFGPMESVVDEGAFTIRSAELRHIDEVTTMRISARIAAEDSLEAPSD